jgi:hypothetical protein
MKRFRRLFWLSDNPLVTSAHAIMRHFTLDSRTVWDSLGTTWRCLNMTNGMPVLRYQLRKTRSCFDKYGARHSVVSIVGDYVAQLQTFSGTPK